MEEKVVKVLNEMSEYLTIAQMKKLQEVILDVFSENTVEKSSIPNEDFLQMFLDAKKIEGCSERTLQYYYTTVAHMLSKMETPVRKITTEEIRTYLSEYHGKGNKEWRVYFDAKAKVHLKNYIEKRHDDNKALVADSNTPEFV